MAWTKTSDGSIVDQDGKVIFFSTRRFIDDICIGNCCFICGAKPEEKQFDDEHVFPEWLLRRYNLFARTITLPNGETTFTNKPPRSMRAGPMRLCLATPFHARVAKAHPAKCPDPKAGRPPQHASPLKS